MDNRNFSTLLRQAQKTARDFHDKQQEFHNAFIDRYGMELGQTDSDQLIDAIDYGQGNRVSLTELDRVMRDEFGKSPREPETST